MNRDRLSKFMSGVITGVIAMNGLPSIVLADVINTPTYYSVQPDLTYEISTNITSSWINHESVDFVITNTGSETIHNWYLTLNLPYNIDNIWNGSLYETDGNGTYTITSNGWNQDIHSGESVTVGITFSSDTETELSVDPEWYLLNTQATVVDASQYTLEYTEYSAWETGFTGQLTLTPQVDCQHWELSFGSNREITAVSSAVLISEGENNYAITHDENNMRIFAGTAYNFGIQGVNTEDPLDMSNVELTVVDLAYHLTDDADANGVPDYLEFIGGGSIINPTPTPTPIPTDVPTETPTTEPTGTETPTPTEEPTPTPIIDYESDQDLDGLPDYIEDQLGTDPLKTDTDEDGLTDYVEIMIGYDPTNPDTDNNGIADGNEDCDNDGLSNAYELNLGTNPVMEDTDCDRLNDGDEVNVYGTDPLVPDSDGDGICDGDEISMGKNPSDPTDGATRISQSLTQEINNAEDPAITSVTVTADLAGKIDRVLDVRDYYNIDVYSTDVYGRIGSPINFECDEEFDSATVVIHYDESQLINTPENSLGVLWYDEENNIYELQEQAVVDTANNQITLEVEHFSTYVLVNTTMWFNPVRPNYYGYFYYPNSIVQMDDVQGSYTLQTYEDIAWADFQAEHGENFVRVNTVYSYDYHMSGNHYYLYEWLAIDTTDSDEDGALDFMETLGVLGSNHHTYYSDVGNPDSDGDTLPDGVELGNIYLLGKFTDNNYLEKYRRDVDGTITPCQDFHKFDFFRSILFSRSVAAVACIHSDPNEQDSDRDSYYDSVDRNPICSAWESIRLGGESYEIFDKDDEGYIHVEYDSEWYYGGYQGWFDDEIISVLGVDLNPGIRSTGCGLIATADILLYLNYGGVYLDWLTYHDYVMSTYCDFYEFQLNAGAGLFHIPIPNSFFVSPFYIQSCFLHNGHPNWQYIVGSSNYGCITNDCGYDSDNLLYEIERSLQNNRPVVLMEDDPLVELSDMVNGRTQESEQSSIRNGFPIYEIVDNQSRENVFHRTPKRMIYHYVTITGVLIVLDTDVVEDRIYLRIQSWGEEYYINYYDFVQYNAYSNDSLCSGRVIFIY